MVLLLSAASPASSLNFDLAVDLGMFDSIERVGSGDDFLAFSPDKDASHAWVYSNSASSGLQDVNLTTRISEPECDSQSDSATFNDEISLMILKYNWGSYSDGWMRGEVRVGVNDGSEEEWFVVVKERLNPEAADVEEGQHLFNTWMINTSPTSPLPWSPNCSKKSITVEMRNWQPDSEIYFVATIHRRLRDRNEAGVSPCPYAEEFGCVENVGEHQLCILTDPLTCNLLPNCAQNVIPNRDEDCSWGWSFDDALRAMVFTLAAVCTILLCIGCIRTCVIRSLRRRNGSAAAEASDNGDGTTSGRRRRASFLNYVSASLPRRRPANAPPTYDDAVKNDNEAFEWEEPPPEYHERPPPEGGEAEASGAAAVAVTVTPNARSDAETERSESTSSRRGGRARSEITNTTPSPPQSPGSIGGDELPADPPSYESHRRPQEDGGSEQEEAEGRQEAGSSSSDRNRDL